MGLLNAERIVHDVLQLVNAQDEATFSTQSPFVRNGAAHVAVK
jgi:hypothetical protein